MTKALTPIAKLLKEVDEEKLLSFTPTAPMERAKFRFWKTLNDNHLLKTNVGDLTLSALAEHSGSPSFMTWADKHPMFLPWFCDEKFSELTIETLAEKALRRLDMILDSPYEPKILTAKDHLTAINMSLQLADRFPNKRREFVYVDKELAKMTEADVDKEMKAIETQLAGKTLPAARQDDVDNEE